MYQVDEILNLLNEKLGSDQLSWKGDHSSIKFEDGSVVDFIKIDTQTIELVNVIEKYTKVADATLCANILMANYQGGMTGQSRLSLTPDQRTLALCCRIDVRWVDAALFEEILTDFLKYIQFWNSDEAAEFLSGDEASDNSMSSQSDHEAFFTKV